jgi:hypothetical protein
MNEDEELVLKTNVRKHMKSLTISIRLTGVKGLMRRMWIAGKLIRLAAWVAGTEFEVVVTGHEIK